MVRGCLTLSWPAVVACCDGSASFPFQPKCQNLEDGYKNIPRKKETHVNRQDDLRRYHFYIFWVCGWLKRTGFWWIRPTWLKNIIRYTKFPGVTWLDGAKERDHSSNIGTVLPFIYGAPSIHQNICNEENVGCVRLHSLFENEFRLI